MSTIYNEFLSFNKFFNKIFIWFLTENFFKNFFFLKQLFYDVKYIAKENFVLELLI